MCSSVSNHLLSHRATIFYTAMQGSRSIMGKPHDCHWAMVSVPKKSLLNFWTLRCNPKRWIRENGSSGHSGATPSDGFVRTVKSKDVHLPSKKHLSSPKMGVSRCQPQAQQAHTSGVSPGLLYPPETTSNTNPFPQCLQARKERYNWVVDRGRCG
jgi:hypothetical protein